MEERGQKIKLYLLKIAFCKKKTDMGSKNLGKRYIYYSFQTVTVYIRILKILRSVIKMI